MSNKPSPSATIAVLGPDQLGEGPVWDDRSGELVRVDISGRLVHRWNPTTDQSTSFETEGDVGAVVLCDDGGLVLAIECELWRRDTAGEMTLIGDVEARPGVRFNDCRADPRGRLWAGTLHRDREPRQAALYRLDPGGVLTTVLPERTISNGIGWSPAARRCTTSTARPSESPSSTTTSTPVSSVSSDSSPRSSRPTACPMVSPSTPTVACGCACSVGAGFAGTCLMARWIRRSCFRSPIPTCPAFGGEDLSTLYVTTARHRLTDEQLAREPLAGAVLQIDVGVTGCPAHRFAG